MRNIIFILLSLPVFASAQKAVDGFPLVDGGFPLQIAKVALVTQSAAINATTVYAVVTDGFYTVNYCATVTRAATTSSTLGALQLKWTGPDNVVKTWPSNNTNGLNQAATNATGTAVIGGSVTVYAKAGSNLQYIMGYTSSGGTTMQYSLHIIIQKL